LDYSKSTSQEVVPIKTAPTCDFRKNTQYIVDMMMRGIVSKAARAAMRPSTAGKFSSKPAIRLMSSLDKKEKGDERAYFAREEAARLSEMQAKLQAIMESDKLEDKEKVQELLGKFYNIY
jgi:hypothetical protein